MKAIQLLLLGLACSTCFMGCVVEERAYVGPGPRCRNAVWVRGHYGPYGRYHPGHWRCGRAVYVVE